MDEPRWLSSDEDRAWRGYRRLSLLLDRQLARDLAAESQLSEADYDVLSNLGETPGGRIRLTDLAAHMRWSPSRLSHHVARMRRRGLVTREASPDDGRGSVIVLSGEGRRTIEAAAPRHVASVRRHFLDLLTPAQVQALAALSDTVVEHLLKAESE